MSGATQSIITRVLVGLYYNTVGIDGYSGTLAAKIDVTFENFDQPY
jgi:hypothetical protein